MKSKLTIIDESNDTGYDYVRRYVLGRYIQDLDLPFDVKGELLLAIYEERGIENEKEKNTD